MVKNKDIRELAEQVHLMNMDEQMEQLIFSDTNNQNLMNLCEELNIYFAKQLQRKMEYERTQGKYQQMLSNISHDIKTPLTVISGLLEMIHLQDMPPDVQKVYLSKMDVKVNEVIHMVHAFFDLNKLEANDSVLEREALNIVELCRKSVLAQYDVIRKAGLAANVDLPDERIYIEVNAIAMERVLANLLTNAITYGAAGGIVGLRVKNKDDQVEIIVWDKGKGIAEKHYNQVFERLFTLEDSRNKNYSGSGLGLTIIKRLLEKQGGYITLESVPYQYTEFKIIFRKQM